MITRSIAAYPQKHLSDWVGFGTWLLISTATLIGSLFVEMFPDELMFVGEVFFGE
jgi:hypothetical protein